MPFKKKESVEALNKTNSTPENITISRNIDVERLNQVEKRDKVLDILSDLATKVTYLIEIANKHSDDIQNLKNPSEKFKATVSPEDVSQADGLLPDWLRDLKNDILGFDVKLILNNQEANGGSTLIIPQRLSLEKKMKVAINEKGDITPLKDEFGDQVYYEDRRTIHGLNVFGGNPTSWETWLRKVKTNIIKAYEANQLAQPKFNLNAKF